MLALCYEQQATFYENGEFSLNKLENSAPLCLGVFRGGTAVVMPCDRMVLKTAVVRNLACVISGHEVCFQIILLITITHEVYKDIWCRLYESDMLHCYVIHRTRKFSS